MTTTTTHTRPMSVFRHGEMPALLDRMKSTIARIARAAGRLTIPGRVWLESDYGKVIREIVV